MLSYYQQPFGQRTDRDDSEMEDKVQELQQQTLAMQAQWHQQQAGMHACRPHLLTEITQGCNAITQRATIYI